MFAFSLHKANSTMLIRRLAAFLVFGIISLSVSAQSLNWSDTRAQAAEEDKKVLLVFSGSDWCRGCILFDQQVLQDSKFQALASDRLALYKADFPRKKKNKPEQTVIRQNEQLIQQFNPTGTFPFVLLLNEEDEVLLKAEGTIDRDEFMASIRKATE
ncbi:MAG: thioredoxin family protein [Cytophagales bacterium]|nr:thioredoxin family protein [Cytophagales bacterium]